VTSAKRRSAIQRLHGGRVALVCAAFVLLAGWAYAKRVDTIHEMENPQPNQHCDSIPPSQPGSLIACSNLQDALGNAWVKERLGLPDRRDLFGVASVCSLIVAFGIAWHWFGREARAESPA
jgi:hypothetical protein